jgi:hypothetical protein
VRGDGDATGTATICGLSAARSRTTAPAARHCAMVHRSHLLAIRGVEVPRPLEPTLRNAESRAVAVSPRTGVLHTKRYSSAPGMEGRLLIFPR